MVPKCVVVFVLVNLLVFLHGVESRKSFGSRSRPSYSARQPAHHYPSPASLSYPSHSSHPSISSHSVSPNYGFNTGHSNPPSIGFKPAVTQGHSSNPSKPYPSVNSQSNHGAQGPPIHSSPNYGFNNGQSNPPSIGFKPSVTQGHSGSGSVGFKTPSAPPAEHAAVHTKPLGSASNSGNSANPPPYGFKPAVHSSSNTPPPYGFKPSAPVGPAVNSKPLGNTPPGAPYPIQPPAYSPHNPGVPPPAYNPAHNPAGYGPPPAYNYGSYGQHYPHQPGYSYPQHSSGEVTNININNINTNTHHYGGYGGGYGGGFGYSYPSYHYSSNEVGSGALGFFLGYSLAKITTPTIYSHPTFYNGYTPRYDHYEIHHYYHNRDTIPSQTTIQPNTIVGCVGDSGTICPSGTTSLCTNNGAILCVASATSTVPCSDQTQGNCIKSVVPCVNGTGGCQVGQNTTLTIPCISKAQVPGNITYVNNTIIVNQTTIIHNSNGTIVQNGSMPLGNVTSDAVSLLQNVTTVTNNTRRRREAATMNEFCVTILALPAERKPSEQQQLLDKTSGIFSKFLVKALGIP